MQPKIKFCFTAKIWQYTYNGGWHFLSLPKELSEDIRTHLGKFEEGWGRLKVTAEINTLVWQTAIWFDTKHETYLLPLKAEIRNKLKLEIDDKLTVNLKL